MRPTGRLHLGNYKGALENWVRLQDDYECFFAVVDWHALTTGYENTSEIKDNIREMVLDWLAAGLDPERSVIFVQSHIKEHAELHLLLSMVTPLGWLERVPTYKEQLGQLSGRDIATYGFLGYPVLQTADILAYRADTVPVGEDQLPHLELAREIIRRFNFLYGSKLPEPQPALTRAAVLPGTDNRKMSKSYGNYLGMSADAQEIRQKVHSMVTDPARIHKTDPGHPDICAVYALHRVFSGDRAEEIGASCRAGAIGCGECKKNLTARLDEAVGPIAERRAALAARPGLVDEVIAAGDARARRVAAETLEIVRAAMRI